MRLEGRRRAGLGFAQPHVGKSWGFSAVASFNHRSAGLVSAIQPSASVFLCHPQQLPAPTFGSHLDFRGVLNQLGILRLPRIRPTAGKYPTVRILLVPAYT